MSEGENELDKWKRIVLSHLISGAEFDFKLMRHLVEKAEIAPWCVQVVRMVVEDVNYNSENYGMFEKQ